LWEDIIERRKRRKRRRRVFFAAKVASPCWVRYR